MAKATVGKVNVKLTANTTAFTKGMRRARRTMARFGTAIRGVARRVGGFAMKIGALVGGGGFALLTASAFKTSDTLAKTADKLGMSTEALASLQHAAEITGVEFKTLDKGLQNMVRNVAEATTGTGEAVDVLAQLGINVQALAKMSPDKMFREVAGAMESVEDHSQRVLIAYKLFGGRGTALLNTLKLGSAGLDEQAQMAEKLGLVITRIDAKKIENANDAIARARLVSTGLFRQLAVRLAPMVDYIATGFVNWATAGEGAGARIDAILRIIKAGFGGLLDTLQDIKVRFVTVKGRMVVGAYTIKVAFLEVANAITTAFTKAVTSVDTAMDKSRYFRATSGRPRFGAAFLGVFAAPFLKRMRTVVGIGAQGAQLGVGARLAAARKELKMAVDDMNEELRALDIPWSTKFFDWLTGIRERAADAARAVTNIGAAALGVATDMPKLAMAATRFAPALEKGGAAALRAQFSARAQSADHRLQTAIEKNTAGSVTQLREANRHLQDVATELRTDDSVILSMGGP